jgi:hypothetical protein
MMYRMQQRWIVPDQPHAALRLPGCRLEEAAIEHVYHLPGPWFLHTHGRAYRALCNKHQLFILTRANANGCHITTRNLSIILSYARQAPHPRFTNVYQIST